MSKILIIDDSESIREFLKAVLELAGNTVIQAENGKDALDKLDNEINLIICDLHMPVMDGLEFVIEARKIDRFKYTPILMLTTENSTEQKKIARDAGATGWITKPVTSDKINEYVVKIIRK